MSPRPRKITDDELFAAAARVMQRVGPAELTLAAIAGEAGVTPGALVQRFGSKRALLVALSERVAADSAPMMTGFAARHRSPLAALRAYAEAMAHLAPSPAAYARNLAYLINDLTDPALRRPLVRQAGAHAAALRDLVESAKAQGELTADAKAAPLARTLEAVIAGSMLTWALYRKGSAARWIRTHVDAVLAPYVP
jgi:AcrR family transcriptional regulator